MTHRSGDWEYEGVELGIGFKQKRNIINFIIFALSLYSHNTKYFMTESTKTLKDKPLVEHVLTLALDLINAAHMYNTKVGWLELQKPVEVSVFCLSLSLLPLDLLPCCALQIDYFNNQIIVDLVEQQHKGIIAILDDACMNVGKVTDEMFLEALNSKLGKHGHFSSRKVMRTSSPFDV